MPFTVVASHAEEVLSGDSAALLAQRNAVAKVRGAELPDGLAAGTFVLGTDTLVTIDGAALGKPGSAEEAAAMLARLSGRTHQVVSGVALARTRALTTGAGSAGAAPQGRSSAGAAPQGRSSAGAAPHGPGSAGAASVLEEPRVGCATTEVTFVRLSDEDIAAYVGCGEWKGKAGAYAIQGIAALFASEVRGEYSNVVGLPLWLLARLFRESGFDLLLRRWL